MNIEVKRDCKLPHLDLEQLVMGNYQLMSQADLPKNIDLDDIHTFSGSGTLNKEMSLIEGGKMRKQRNREEEVIRKKRASQLSGHGLQAGVTMALANAENESKAMAGHKSL